MITVTQDLRDEHEIIKRVMELLEKVIRLNKIPECDLNQTQNEIVYFLKIFVDRCHHGKEEKILFHAMISAGIPLEAPILGILDEHTKGRFLVNSMERAAKSQDTQMFNHATAAYLELLDRHMKKENLILFENADQLIPHTDIEHLIKRYDEHEEKVIGSGIHDKLLGLIEKWDEQTEFDEDLPA